MDYDWGKMLSDFEHSPTGIEIIETGGIGIKFRQSSEGQVYIVVNSSREFVEGLPKYYYPLESNEQRAEL